MPYAVKIDPKLLNFIPKETLENVKIEYENDNIHIKSWQIMETRSSNDSNNDDRSGEDSGSMESDQSESSNEHNISSNSQIIGDSSDQEGMDEDGSNDNTQTMKLKDKGHLGY